MKILHFYRRGLVITENARRATKQSSIKMKQRNVMRSFFVSIVIHLFAEHTICYIKPSFNDKVHVMMKCLYGDYASNGISDICS